MNTLNIILSCIFILTIHSYPLIIPFNLDNLSPSQINHFCSYISQLQHKPNDLESPKKRFARPFPDMSRFFSTSDKIHNKDESKIKSETESINEKHDVHAYLCSLSKNSEEMSNVLSIFVEEYGDLPTFNIFESCEQVAKRDQSISNTKQNNDKSSVIQLNELSKFCSNKEKPKFTKRWKNTVGGPMSIDFIHQMLESRKVKSYPYRAEMDPYLVGR